MLHFLNTVYVVCVISQYLHAPHSQGDTHRSDREDEK